MIMDFVIHATYTCEFYYKAMLENHYFIYLGLLGAIVANSTGAGGGIVFVPAFYTLGLDSQSILATSFAIQCFGMTAGAFVWSRQYRREQHALPGVWQNFPRLFVLFAVSSVLGIVFTQYGQLFEPQSLHIMFKILSGAFAVALILIVCVIGGNRSTTPSEINRVYYLLFPIIGFFGGMLTAWLSVGVGEIIAVVMILLGFNALQSVAVAVCVSAVTVWAGISYHVFVDANIRWDILVFAGPAALVGGVLARYLANFLGPLRLKLFMAFWILMVAVFM